MTILNESGVPDVLSPLHAVNDLAAKMPGAVIAVIGTRAETYLAQSLTAALGDGSSHPGRNQRVMYIVLDPSDPPDGGRIASRLITEAAGISGVRMMLLVASRSVALIGVDPDFEARLIARRLDIPVRNVSLGPDIASPASLSTDLEDRSLTALVDLCPTGTSDRLELPSMGKRSRLLGNFLGGGREETRVGYSRPVVLLGSSGEELRPDLERVGVEVEGNIPGPDAAVLPEIGEHSVVAVTDSYLVGAARAAEEKGAKVARTMAPIGVDGTARFIQDVAAAAGTGANELGRARAAWKSMEHLRNRVRGKRVFFAGDTGYEIPLARFLADAGAVVLEVGAPRLDRRALVNEIQALGAGVDVVESPDWMGQMKRADETRPDIVISGAGLYAPLVASGHLCRSIHDFAAVGMHGYEGARHILELLIRTFERGETLDSVSL